MLVATKKIILPSNKYFIFDIGDFDYSIIKCKVTVKLLYCETLSFQKLVIINQAREIP